MGTNEWFMEDINVGDDDGEIYECYNNSVLFMDYGYNEICVERRKINDDDLRVLIKKGDDDGDDVGFSLIDEGNWNETYDIDNMDKRLCRYMDHNDNKLCVELTIDIESEGKQIKEINKISIEKMLQNIDINDKNTML